MYCTAVTGKLYVFDTINSCQHAVPKRNEFQFKIAFEFHLPELAGQTGQSVNRMRHFEETVQENL